MKAKGSAPAFRLGGAISLVALAVALVSCAAKERARRRARPGLMKGGAESPMTLDEPAPAEEAEATVGGEGGLVLIDSLAAPAKKKNGGGKRPVKTWKRSQAEPNASKLMIGDKQELPLKGVQANVRIDGFRARVVLDLYYFNDKGRQFEGTFKLRLPNEASPFMFAFGQSVLVAGGASDEPRFILDRKGQESLTVEEVMRSRAETWENVKEARMVPKEKAAFAYTETVRRRVDPALMEWSGAGIFSARVFPLAPRKLHRIVIGYDVDLLQVGDDLLYRFDLPSGVKRRVVDIDVAELKGVAVAVTGETEGAKASGRIHYRFENPDVKTITVRQKSPGTIMLVGDDLKTGRYFATRFRPDLPKAEAKGRSSRAIFLVDTSLSSNPERFNIWLKLMKAILENNRDSIKHFDVLFFNVEAFWWRGGVAPPNTPANVEALMAYARELVLEGATDLGTAFEALARLYQDWSASRPNDDLFLLSDAAATWGEDNLHALLKPTYGEPFIGPLFAYTTGFAGTDTKALQHLARETGGAVFSVVGEAQVEAASRAHRLRPWEIKNVLCEGISDALLAGNPYVIYPGQSLLLVGRGTPKVGSRIGLLLSPAPMLTSAHGVGPDHQLESDLAPRLYGQVATGQLEDFREATEEVAAAYSRHFRVTGRTCSLLMLETEEDYKRFDIKPEEDAFVVKGKLASEVVAKALAEIGDALADAKKRFMAWLGKMERMPGFKFKVPTALRMALDKMPRKSFEVAPKPLKCNLRKWDDVPGPLQEMLVSKKLDYDAISKEAQRRLASGDTLRASKDKVAPESRPRVVGQPTGDPRKVSPLASAADALKALSSLVENSPGDGVLARDIAFSAMEWGLDSQAYYLLRRVAASRPYEPQTYRALARVLAEMNKADLAMAYYEVGLAGKWNNRFGEFRKILGMDYLRFLRRVVNDPAARPPLVSVPDFAAARLETVAKEFDTTKGKGADLMVTITWNTDSTDIDLHVKEPTGEECYYKHRDTRIGGHITKDVTQGYGPEMYTLAKAVRGRYRVRVKFYSSNRNRASARTKVYATICENWGRPTERVTRKVIPLVEGKEFRDVGTVVVKK